MADRIGILNDIVVAGVSLRDTYGIVPTGECVYNAPERDVEFIEVPGRNGDLIIDNGRFKNIEIKYPCSIAKDFPANVDGLRAFLASQLGYIRISDTYHPDEYRLGVYASGLETVNGTLNRVGSFDLIFNCKPQRFLRSGDEPVELLQMAYIATATTYKWSTLEIPAELVGPSTTFSSPAGYGYLVESRDAYDHKIGEYTGTSSGSDYSVYLSSLMTSGAAYCVIYFNQPTNGAAENCVRMRWQDDDGAHDARSAVELTNPTLYTAKPLISAHGGNGIGEIQMQIGDVFVYTNLLGSSTGTEDFTSYIDTEDEASYYVDTATGSVTPFNYSGANRVDGLTFSEYNIGLGKAVLSPGTTYVGMTTANVTATGDAMSAYIYPRWWTI